MNAFITVFGVFLVISAGALFVASLQTRSRATIGGGVVAGLIGILFIILGFSIVSVAPNERLVVFNRVTGDLQTPREPGLAIVNPLTTSYRTYDVSRQTYTMSAQRFEGQIEGDDAIEARTSGGQQVFIDVSVIYRIDPAEVNRVHVSWPNDRYRTELIRPLLRSVVRDAVSLFPVESVYQERDTIDRQITESVTGALEREGFLLEDVLVRDVRFSPEYATSIEAAQVAEVRIRQEEFVVQEREQQALQREAEAQGRANARVIEAQAEAEALQLIADVLAENPALLEYQYIQNLSDQVQVLALPSTSPYIFDLQSVLDNPLPSSDDDDDDGSIIPTTPSTNNEDSN